MEYEYKVIDVADGSISSALLGDGRTRQRSWILCDVTCSNFTHFLFDREY
jgi:hypothetical protein